MAAGVPRGAAGAHDHEVILAVTQRGEVHNGLPCKRSYTTSYDVWYGCSWTLAWHGQGNSCKHHTHGSNGTSGMAHLLLQPAVLPVPRLRRGCPTLLALLLLLGAAPPCSGAGRHVLRPGPLATSLLCAAGWTRPAACCWCGRLRQGVVNA